MEGATLNGTTVTTIKKAVVDSGTSTLAGMWKIYLLAFGRIVI